MTLNDMIASLSISIILLDFPNPNTLVTIRTWLLQLRVLYILLQFALRESPIISVYYFPKAFHIKLHECYTYVYLCKGAMGLQYHKHPI